jgi:hypothetical protein
MSEQATQDLKTAAAIPDELATTTHDLRTIPNSEAAGSRPLVDEDQNEDEWMTTEPARTGRSGQRRGGNVSQPHPRGDTRKDSGEASRSKNWRQGRLASDAKPAPVEPAKPRKKPSQAAKPEVKRAPVKPPVSGWNRKFTDVLKETPDLGNGDPSIPPSPMSASMDIGTPTKISTGFTPKKPNEPRAVTVRLFSSFLASTFEPCSPAAFVLGLCCPCQTDLCQRSCRGACSSC